MSAPASDSGSAILTGRDLLVEGREAPLLDIEEIEVRGGEILSVLGPNGAGKSTLLRVLAMLQTPHSGSISFLGHSGGEAEKLMRRHSAFVFQRPHLWAGTVRSNIEL